MRYKFILSISALALLACSPELSNDSPQSEGAIVQVEISGIETGTLLAPEATREVIDEMALEKASSAEPQKASPLPALISAIESVRAHGLNPEHYHLTRLKDDRLSETERQQLAIDGWLSASAHIAYGKLDAVSIEPDWTAGKRELNLPAAFQDALTTGEFQKTLDNIAPKHASYQALKSELARLLELEKTPITQIEPGEVLKLKMRGPRVSALQTRLSELEFLTPEQISGEFDETTKEAVKRFQDYSELDADGVAGAGTLNALNRDLGVQIEQVRANLERWRWLPDNLGERHLRTNIAGFTTQIFEQGEPVRTHLVIIGKTYRKTPVFSDKVEYIVFNPWWETPYSIATRDKLPVFKKDPGAAERSGFEVVDRNGQVIPASSVDWNSLSASNFPYRLRQRPGDQNALGQVKIMFPNQHNVYMHDTPTRGLFSQRQRAFSSGCVRTQNPIDLSEWLLSETPSWNRARIDSALATKKETRADLARPVPVHILYMTVVKEENGVRYLDDIYARDGKVIAGLDETPA
ncbi:MAG: L,D-transpeptidase family protein [Hellea sp.]|nr:L,D-transpeptidase family protein [Hellea sp.]